MAGSLVTGLAGHGGRFRAMVAAVRLGVGAAGVEAASGRRRGGARHVSGQRYARPAPPRIDGRHRRQQRLRVGMGGARKQGARACV